MIQMNNYGGSPFQLFKTILSTHVDPVLRDLHVTKADIHGWLKEADVKKCSKKYNSKRSTPPPSPLSYIHVLFEALPVVVNDAFCDSPEATLYSATRATRAAAHVAEVMGKEAGWRVWDEAPSGTWQKTSLPPEGEVFRTNYHLPTYHPHGPSRGIAFLLAPAPKPSERAPKRARMIVMDSRLQEEGPGKD